MTTYSMQFTFNGRLTLLVCRRERIIAYCVMHTVNKPASYIAKYRYIYTVQNGRAIYALFKTIAMYLAIEQVCLHGCFNLDDDGCTAYTDFTASH